MKTTLLLIGAVVGGCAIAPYDQVTDTSLSGIQSKFDGHISDMGAGNSKSSDDFYKSIRADLHSLSIRLAARQQGDPSVQREAEALTEVSSIIDDLQKLESAATTQPDVIGTAQAEFDNAIQAVLSLELRRK